MDDWVALLRGVNVGGGNKVPMAQLRDLATGLGWQGVRTYIASGNLVFRADGTADDLAAMLRTGMAAQMGVSVPILLLPGADIQAALAACPFQPDKGSHVHVFFLFGPPTLDTALRDALIAPTETLIVEDSRVWLHAPEGIGRSKLAEKLHKVITGTNMTARNLSTLRALVGMLEAKPVA